jgi:nitrite reductase/ring-hydroxylating ferredoxin subunit
LVNCSSKNDTNNVDLRYLCRISDIIPSKSRSFLIWNRSGRELEIAVFSVDGKYHAISNRCKHEGGPLSEGVLREGGSDLSVAWMEVFYR